MTPEAPPPLHPPPPQSPPPLYGRPPTPGFGWFIASGATAMLVGCVDLVAAGLSDCMAACDHVMNENTQAKTEAHQAAFLLVLAVVIFTGGGLCFGKNRVGAGIVALAAPGNVSYFALISVKTPAALPLVVMGVAAAALPVVAILRRTLAARGG